MNQRWWCGLACLVLSLFVATAPAPAPAADEPLDLGGVREEHALLPMRDGTRLSAYLYFPAGEGPWPVLYEQRYADLRGKGTREAYARLARAGLVVCAENFRGAGQSEGTWVGYRALGWGELQDGYDSVEWLAKQPWSTGKIGTFGSSQAGFAQNFLAVTRPPHLVAQYMIDTGLSLFHEGYRIGGAWRPERFKLMGSVCREPAHNLAVLDEWLRHPTYDDYWQQEDCARHIDKMDVPCFTIGSWFDFMNIGSIESYRGRQHRAGPGSRGRQQLLIGPWLHGGYLGKNTGKVSELQFPDNAKFDAEQHLIRWFDYWLKGRDNQVERDPAVRYYVMGAVGEPGAPGNVWRETSDWPVSATATPYYLHADKTLTTRSPESADAAVTFKADPLHPAEIPNKRGFPGAADARTFEEQGEVRTFTTEVLTQPVEWTGLVKAELFVTTTARDTDFIVRVSDVYPDGRSILLVDYIRRGRYRDGYEQEVFFEPGKVAKVAFDVGWLSQVFAAGHRIRVTVASTGAPFYEPNPNTGKPMTLDMPADAVTATNTVLVNGQHASRVIAPLRTAGDRP
ncbi:CocE/NonD family hydrolase [Planctomyces sp. SH-PL14]|uniref:CocE/NonD family hydrolase n=1 Tax=Planctomyces sp. SH-PL14 TaxID=1632864 RepID=UPI00078B6EE0|nr:CocE/NonD family hydrolase [Planctomyces sp. SH-PL14]AMV18972.1 Cocaine esterase [Planctomyces sp. SH-PL14]